MTTGGYGTTPEEMARAGERALRVEERIRADLAALRGQVEAVRAGWRGEAATSFAGLMQRWDTDAGRLSAALRGIGESIIGSGRSYRQAEADHAAALASLRAAMEG